MLRAIDSTKAVFPIEGRAAMMIRSEGCHPSVTRSMAMNPDGTPLKALVFLLACSICARALARISLAFCTERLTCPLRDLEYLALGKTYQIRHILILVVGAALDLRGRAYQLALDIFLGYDLGMELDVGRRPDLLRQLREICRPPTFLSSLRAFRRSVTV